MDFIKEEVNKKNDLGETMIHVELQRKPLNMETIAFVIENTRDLNAEDDTGMIPIIYASSNGFIDIVKLLVDKGACVNVESDTVALIEASKYGYIDIVKFLVEKGADVDYESIESTTALLEVSKYGYIDIFNFLIENGANININASLSCTPLHYAIQNNHMEIAKLLIGMEVDVNIEDGDGLTPLHYAVKASNRDMIEFLIEKGANINLKSRNAEVALKYPYDKDDEGMVEFMLEKGAEGKTFLEHARYTNKKWFTDLILKTHSLKNPKRLVEILTNFTNETPIKYTTHEWKNRIPEKYIGNFKLFLEDVAKQFSEIDSELTDLSLSLRNKIYDFILNKDVADSWVSVKGLEAFVNAGGEPKDFALEDGTFNDKINAFKHTIEFRNNADKLKEVFDKWKEELGRGYKLTIDTSLEGVSIYTDTKLFTETIDSIFKYMRDEKAEHKVIDVKCIKDFKTIELRIEHKNSKAKRSAKEMLERVTQEKGDMAGKSMTNLCDWSIESASAEGEYYKVNYLKSDADIDDIETLTDVPDDFGFTHIFRFYK